ncbi:ABC transporter ATP-binding protein [Bacteroides sp. AN502(2024)]|uniref:ABC transporter ATP-binding protein n=1 Tax=Bacteroides sp. AN502(2024) TaxID=3160599 RepID=UPI003515B20B
MDNTAIQFDRVGKLYRLGLVGTGTLSHDLNRWWKTTVLGKEDPYLRIGESNDRSKKGSSDYVWALKDISFDVRQGDVVGIIGKNGAGKSTLLKILSRVTAPTSGVIRARGRIASLLEVGTGFHPELTGRENIYMNGSIMGMTHDEIGRKLDEIVDFAGVERYIDTPVKRYSSGMIVRLGFSVAAFLEPEILVVDEVLAVGDAEFQKKALGKMHDVSQGSGRTVLFVSHNMAAVNSLCTHGVVLSNGRVDFIGKTAAAIEHYLASNRVQSEKTMKEQITFVKPGIRIHQISLNGSESASVHIASGQREITLRIEGETEEEMWAEAMLILKTRDEVPMASFAEGDCKGSGQKFGKGRFVIERTIELPKFLCSGDLVADIHLHYPMLEWLMKAPACAEIHSDGYQEGMGKPVLLKEQGFMGLERIDRTDSGLR